MCFGAFRPSRGFVHHYQAGALAEKQSNASVSCSLMVFNGLLNIDDAHLGIQQGGGVFLFHFCSD